MAENSEEKGSGAWAKVPTWDGAPAKWRAFQREMKWWVSSLDLESTKKYNLAARFLLRQTGIVRQRGEEFSPEDLQYRPALTITDPDSGEVFEMEKKDYLFGLNKLMQALEGINGMTALDTKGELRSQFYLGTQRRPGEREREFRSFLHGFDLLWQIFARNRCSCRPLRLVGIIRRSLDLILCASSCLRLHRKVRRIIRQLRLKH
jgi:hypothetical protein